MEDVRVSPRWLTLREPADAAARSHVLVDQLLRTPTPSAGWVIHDLACGSGSMGRWLAPQLPGPQRWVLHDRDADLLSLAAVDVPSQTADDAPISIAVQPSDITLLRPEDLAGATLVTASALLDMLTPDELDHLIGLCSGTGCPILLALSVVGRVELSPTEPLDEHMAAAFNAHQTRMTARGPLLGPDAVAAAVDGFRTRGAEVLMEPSPWRLGPAEAELTAEWFTGWVGAACEQQPDLASDAADYARRRLAQATAGQLAVTVGHADLLVRP